MKVLERQQGKGAWRKSCADEGEESIGESCVVCCFVQEALRHSFFFAKFLRGFPLFLLPRKK